MTPHQATAVEIGGRALLIEGPPGSGKSSLALALIDRGARLIGDDSVMLEVSGRQLLLKVELSDDNWNVPLDETFAVV